MLTYLSTLPIPAKDSIEEAARLRTVLITVATSVAVVLFCAGKAWSDGRTAAALSALNLLIFAVHVARFRDAGMARLLGWGLCVGAVELVADALCVKYTGTLDYRVARSAMLWESPWWMPVAWMLVATQIGYFGTRFIERFGVWRGAALSAIVGAVNIPFYEEMARHANWWQYDFCRMLPGTHTPLYIIVAELSIGFAFAPCARVALRGDSWRKVLVAGIVAGIATIIGGLIGFGVAEGF